MWIVCIEVIVSNPAELHAVLWAGRGERAEEAGTWDRVVC